MTGAEHVGKGEASDGAGAAPVGQHGFAEFLLADALADHAFDLRVQRLWRQCGQLLAHGIFITVGSLIGQSPRQAGGTQQQSGKFRISGDQKMVVSRCPLRKTTGQLSR